MGFITTSLFLALRLRGFRGSSGRCLFAASSHQDVFAVRRGWWIVWACSAIKFIGFAWRRSRQTCGQLCVRSLSLALIGWRASAALTTFLFERGLRVFILVTAEIRAIYASWWVPTWICFRRWALSLSKSMDIGRGKRSPQCESGLMNFDHIRDCYFRKPSVLFVSEIKANIIRG